MKKVVDVWVPLKTKINDNMGFESNSTTATVIIADTSCTDDPELDLCESNATNATNATGGRLLASHSSGIAKSVLLDLATQNNALLLNAVDLIDKIVIMEMANGAECKPEPHTRMFSVS